MLSFLTSVAYCATEQLWKCSKFLKYHWFVVIPDFLSHRKTEQHCICCEGFWRKFRIFNFTYCFQVCSECCEFLVYHSYPLYLFFKKDTNCYLSFCLVLIFGQWDTPEDRLGLIGLGFAAVVALWASTNLIAVIFTNLALCWNQIRCCSILSKR
jgi:hypothetical protein